MVESSRTTHADTLSETVNLLRTTGQLYGRLEFTAPWGFDFPGGKGICLMVTRGSCYLGVGADPRLTPLTGGDFVFLSEPESYSLRSSPDRPTPAMSERVPRDAFEKSRLIAYQGGDGPRTSLIAGCFVFATPESEWLARHLPAVLHVSASGAQSPHWFHSTMQFIETEIIQDQPGSGAVVDRLAEVMFIQAVRTLITSRSAVESASWLRGLADPQIAGALYRMHTEPGRQWTVAELATAVSMSRSAFAARFRRLVGTTPLDHLTEWRMVRAAGLMRQGRLTKLSAVAGAVGYESEGAFAKVFRRVMGTPPGRYRRQQRRPTG
jgi:AraC-like DNA-binding protein